LYSTVDILFLYQLGHVPNIIEIKSTDFNKDDNGNLECTAQGQPGLSIKWKLLGIEKYHSISPPTETGLSDLYTSTLQIHRNISDYVVTNENISCTVVDKETLLADCELRYECFVFYVRSHAINNETSVKMKGFNGM